MSSAFDIFVLLPGFMGVFSVCVECRPHEEIGVCCVHVSLCLTHTRSASVWEEGSVPQALSSSPHHKCPVSQVTEPGCEPGPPLWDMELQSLNRNSGLSDLRAT